MELGPEDVSLLERCPYFRGCYVQASVELGPEDVSLLEMCPHLRGCYVLASVELGPEDVSLLGLIEVLHIVCNEQSSPQPFTSSQCPLNPHQFPMPHVTTHQFPRPTLTHSGRMSHAM